MMRLRWPRGRYNSQRIVGFELMFRLDVRCWRVAARWNFGNPVLILGPLQFSGQIAYGLHGWESR